MSMKKALITGVAGQDGSSNMTMNKHEKPAEIEMFEASAYYEMQATELGINFRFL